MGYTENNSRKVITKRLQESSLIKSSCENQQTFQYAIEVDTREIAHDEIPQIREVEEMDATYCVCEIVNEEPMLVTKNLREN